MANYSPQNHDPIGIFDSGIGGLSIVLEIKKMLPLESIVYLADMANFPYGSKSKKEITKISQQNVKWLLSQKAKMIVVACNTATTNSISYLRKKFPEVAFIGVEPAVKPAAEMAKKAIIVLSSPGSTRSAQLAFLIEKFVPNKKIFNIGSLKLVEAVEKGSSTIKIRNELKNTISEDMLNEADTLVLGCTHFPLVRADIQKFVGENITIIDSGEAVARRVGSLLKEKNLLSTGTPFYQFYTTGETKRVRGITFLSIA